MFVKSLELKDYRNYKNLFVEFSRHANIFYGDNAQGKTNILEAVYVSGTTKSHRGSKDREIIHLQKEDAHIRMIIHRDGIDRRIDMHLKKNSGKGVAIDGIPIKKSSELFGIVNFIFFSPEDLSMIKNGPSERRKFLDVELCQLDKLYLYHLSQYNKILVQRNNLLKQVSFNNKLLDTIYLWDEQLVKYGEKIIEARNEYVVKLNNIVSLIHKRLSSNKEELRIEYEPNVSILKFKNQLTTSLNKNIVQKMTTVGPHRDDLSFLINGIDIRKYGSQGQQRTCALSLKLAEIQIVKECIHDTPVLLLDDVLSELDRKRQTELLKSMDDIQTIITCTGMEEFVNSRLLKEKVFCVMDGTIEEKLTNVLENQEENNE